MRETLGLLIERLVVIGVLDMMKNRVIVIIFYMVDFALVVFGSHGSFPI